MTAIKTVKQDNPTSANIGDLLPSDLLIDDEQIVFAVKPSLWTIAFLCFRTVLIAVVVAMLALFAGPFLQLERWSAPIVQGCIVAVLARVVFAFLQWLSRTYVLTDKRVIRIRGVLTIDVFQCSLVRIQNTFLVLTLPQRLLGLGSIVFATAGTGFVEAVWQHVKTPLDIHHQLLCAVNAAGSKSVKPTDGITD
ncbi:MAG: PH domain-containing protein [Sedimentisphaerales bacterium]|nr:PH domain-containing protein [Sedimentisphaerales bacterium]